MIARLSDIYFFNLSIFDLNNITKPEIISRWWMPGMNRAAGEKSTVPAGRRVGELIGADRIFYQDLEDLKSACREVNPAMQEFDCSVFDGNYVTGDIDDAYLAALEASTQCLILTGVGDPLPQLINRAEELEVPLLKVDHDTLTTKVVQIVARTEVQTSRTSLILVVINFIAFH